MRVSSLYGKRYVFVIVNDYISFTQVLFPAHRDEILQAFLRFCKRIQNEKSCLISKIRSHHGGEFENFAFEKFYEENGFKHEFTTPKTS